jgi:pyruvate dehydrogenase E1 component alpha subunit
VRAVATTAKKDSSAAAVAKANLTPEVAKDLYYDMLLGREFEEMCAQMYYRGKMFGFVHLYSGQEAVSSGAGFSSLTCRSA